MNSIRSAAIRLLLRKSNMWNKPIHEIRRDMDKIKATGFPEGIIVKKEQVNEVDCEVFLNRDASNDSAVLYFHGGGFCLGIYHTNREFVAMISKRTGRNIYLPDYRLAPEYPFPAALEDAEAIFLGMLQKGYSANKLAIMGDSSGCALAVSALLKLKQSEVRMPVALAFITPVFDFAGIGETFSTRAGKDPFKLKDPFVISKNYFGLNNPISPMISPFYGDLDGLPQTLIHAGDYDVFLSDAYRFKEKMVAVGGQVELKIWRKMWHIFHMQASLVPESDKALEELCTFIKTKFQ